MHWMKRMTKASRSTAVALALAWLAASATAQDDSGTDAPVPEVAEQEPFDFSSWMTDFHKSPDPDRVAFVISELSREGSFDEIGGLITAFLAEVFRQYPERVTAWVGGVHDLPPDHRHYVYIAVWWSEVPESVALLEKAAAREIADLQEPLSTYIEGTPGALVDMPLDRADRLDMLWAGYFASGKPAYVERITDALDHGGEDDEGTISMATIIAGAAEWSLTSNAYQHDDVREILQDLHDRTDGPRKADLKAILDRVHELVEQRDAAADADAPSDATEGVESREEP